MEKTVTVPKKKVKIKQFLPLYLMALPGLLYLLINNYLPMAGLSIAFRNVNYTKGIWKSDWCGLANFKCLPPRMLGLSPVIPSVIIYSLSCCKL